MREILLTLAMLQPIEYRTDSSWWGCKAYQVGNARGDVLKCVVWPNSYVIEYGIWNRRVISQVVW